MILFISILASFVSFLDSSVINVALPAIAANFGGGLFLEQWVVDAYLITLGSLILIAGSLADVFGQQKILRYGLYGFAITSLLCALAPSGLFLIAGRALQGVAGAMLVPSSLSLLIAHYKGAKQGKAIGTWTAWTGISFIIGPLLGGFLVDTFSWRLIFAINILPIAISLWLLYRLKAADPTNGIRKVDFWGAGLSCIGLTGVVFALIEQPHFGWSHPAIFGPFIAGSLALAAFFANERVHQDPMLPLDLFKARNFLYGNAATLFIYGGLSIAVFLISIFLQQVSSYSALEAGLALVPVTVIMFFLSSRFGALAGTYGPRLFMTMGPLIAALGFVLMLGVGEHFNYWSGLLPGILLFGLGLSITVAPLTTAVLGSIDPSHAGVGSAVNNAIARIAGLIAVALVGIFIGPHIDLEAFRKGVLAVAVLLALGGILSWVGIRTSFSSKSPVL